MKINKLFAILFAVLGVNTLSAQTDVTSTYLTNAGFDDESSWLSGNVAAGDYTNSKDVTGWVCNGGATWSSSAAFGYGTSAQINGSTIPTTNPSGAAEGGALGISVGWSGECTYTQAVTLPAGIYTLTYKAYNANTATQANNRIGFTSSSASFYGKLTQFTTNTWVQEEITFMLKSETAGNISVGISAISGGSGENAKLFIDGITITYKSFDEVNAENPVDITSLLVNPSFEESTTSTANSVNKAPGWTFTTNLSGWLDGSLNTASPSDGSYCYNLWAGTVNSIDINQTVTLPAGKYIVSADLRTDNVNNITNQGVYASIGGIVTKSGTITNVASTWNSAEGWNTLSAEFNNGSEGEVILGISSTGTSGSAGWFQVDNVRLMYLGYDLTAANEQLNTLIATAQEIVTANAAAPKTIENLNTAITAAQNAEQTKDALEVASANLTTAINAANATVDAYTNFKNFLATCNAILTNSEEFEDGAKTTFTEAINAAQTNVEAATTAEAINAEYTTLETARQTYVQKADPINDTCFDYTFKVTNPGLDNGTTGWTSTGGATNQKIASNKSNGIITGNFYENWNGSNFNGEIYQTISNLPSGIYKLKVAAFGAGTNVYANDLQTPVTTSEGAWYEVDQVKVGGTLKFGIKNESANTWMGIDNASLYYYGFDAETAQASVTTLKAEAEALVGKVMNANVATELNNAISGADATKTTRNELNAMIEDLNTAIAAAKASIADYELIAGYIAKANKINESIAADYKTAYDNGTISESAETVFQNLEVATYNYVTKTFNYNVAISSTWNSTGTNTSAAEFSNEHWSGETRPYMNQNDNNGQGWNATSWSLDFDQDVELPAGEYVFKVAGRKSADATLRLVVTQGEETLGTVEDFPNGSTGRGINKAGAASFDANDPAGFSRNDGTGYGWQWRYVKFTLTEKSTVKIAVHAETSAHQNWVSFGDYTVQMTEETYLEANKGGLDAPTAAAEALVDTKPMGDTENAELKAALELPVTTGAELQAKINALNTAVANANAWVAAYNEAKAPLVAALERFETDYNLEGDVDHAYMSNSVWANVLTMVKAASEAKDVTNSYEGFATATEKLVAALDAADTSIAEYKALKEAIDNANAAASVNWGNEPFQRPTEDKEDLTTAINTAQAVYDAATADGDDVTSQTTALNDALDVVNNLVLNAPAEGSVYNIVVATAEHPYENCPVVATLGTTGENNLTGYGFAAKDGYTDGPANMLYTFTKVEDNNYHISVKVKGETVYLTYGSLNGSAAGWKESQIQGTTDANVAGEFEIVASNTTEGVIKIRNTVNNEFLDCETGASIYTNTGMEYEDFALNLVEELSAEINIDAADKYATCVLMFDADLANTDGLTVYVPESYTTQDGLNYFVFKVFEEAVLPAYTPCLLYAKNGFEGTLTGEVKMDGYAYNVAKGGYLYGALESQNITEGYVMVKLDDEEDVKFRNVSQSGIAEGIKIPAGKCWLQVPAVQESVSSFTCLFRGGDASNIDEVLLDKISVKDGAIYTLDGKRVSNIERGKIYVINGQKVIVK